MSKKKDNATRLDASNSKIVIWSDDGITEGMLKALPVDEELERRKQSFIPSPSTDLGRIEWNAQGNALLDEIARERGEDEKTK